MALADGSTVAELEVLRVEGAQRGRGVAGVMPPGVGSTAANPGHPLAERVCGVTRELPA